MAANFNRSVSDRQSFSRNTSKIEDLCIVGIPNQELVDQKFKTRRTRCVVNFAFEDFTRIHAQFSEKNRAAYIETPIYSFFENEKIKFQVRFIPSKHSMNFDAFYRGSDPSTQMFMEVYLVDTNGRRYNYDYGRRVECQLSAQNSESSGHFIYDRDDLEKKRDKLFSGDQLVVALEVSATWVDVSEHASSAEK